MKVTTKELVSMAFLCAVLLAGQVGMAYLPNIEVVSLLVYIYAQVYRKKAFLIVYVFVLIEGCIYGFGLWWFGYLYIWAILALIAMAAGEWGTSVPGASLILGGYGLAFGFLYAIPYFVAGGWAAGFAYWVSGIPFDLLHCVGNVAAALVLYRPVYTLLGRLERAC